MQLNLTVLLFCVLVIQLRDAAAGARRSQPGRLTGECVSLGICKESTNNAIARFGPNVTSMRSPDGEFSVSASFDLFKGAKSVPKGHIRFDYCSQGVAKTCQSFSNWRFKDGCELWVNKFTFWHGFYDAIHPTFGCPFHTGHYTVTNLTLDMKKLEMFPVENREWYVTIRTWDENEDPWLCVLVVFKFFRMGRSRTPSS